MKSSKANTSDMGFCVVYSTNWHNSKSDRHKQQVDEELVMCCYCLAFKPVVLKLICTLTPIKVYNFL